MFWPFYHAENQKFDFLFNNNKPLLKPLLTHLSLEQPITLNVSNNNNDAPQILIIKLYFLMCSFKVWFYYILSYDLSHG